MQIACLTPFIPVRVKKGEKKKFMTPVTLISHKKRKKKNENILAFFSTPGHDIARPCRRGGRTQPTINDEVGKILLKK